MLAKNKKQSMGRRKIEIKKIASEGSRQVCFSKRKGGLFKKANELSILCGAELAILVFSPGGKPYSFSHPCLDLIADRFLNGGDDHHHHQQPSSSTALITTTDQRMYDLKSNQNLNSINILNRRHESCLESIEEEKRRKVELNDVFKSTWFSNENLDKFDLCQLDFLEKKLASIKEQVHKVLMISKSFYEQQQPSHHHHLDVRSMMELSNGVAGANDQGQDLFKGPLNVMNSYGVPNCFPPVYYDHKGAYQFLG